MLGGILPRLGPGTIHRRPDRQSEQTSWRYTRAGLPGEKRKPVKFNPPGLHQDDPVMHINEQIRVWPGGQLDLFPEKGVGLLDGLSIGSRLETLRGGSIRKSARGQGEGRSEHDEQPSISQIRK